MPRSICYAFLILLIATPLLAQTESGDADSTASTSAAAPVQSYPTTDIGDVWRWARRRNADENEQATGRKFLVVAPTIGSRPTTGLTLGLNSNMAFFAGEPASTHISTLSGGFRFSQKHQILTGVRHSVFTKDDRWFVQGDDRLNWTSNNTYGLGTDALGIGAENLKYNYFRVAETAYRKMHRRMFLGGGLIVNVHNDVRPGENAALGWDRSAYVQYTDAHGFSRDGQTSSGANFAFLLDTRDSSINAQRGWYANAAVRTYFNGFLAGDSTWQQVFFDVRTYRPLTRSGRHRLAFWTQTDMVVGGSAPYFDLPATGGSDGRSARGYAEGRYRGERMVYGEIEYRGTVVPSGLLGVVAFLNTTTIGSPEEGTRLFESWAPGGGFGFRVLLNKRSRTNLASDFGWGKSGSSGFYLGIQEAF